jgi:uncharacterized protein YqjF (DUF2071 family)
MDKPSFLSAYWVNLLMANFYIDKPLLEKYKPAHTEIDSWNGNYYVSLVGFLFKDTRVKGIRFPFHSNFEEVNLRFYVKHKHNNEWKRGVVFIKEIVPRRLITFIANTLYKENYETRKMTHSFSTDPEMIVEYKWEVNKEWNFLNAIAHPEKKAAAIGSEEEFITEHYWGYAKVNNRITSEYEVRHPSWLIHPVSSFRFKCDAKELYGPEFEEALNSPPASVFLADGSAISVMNNRKLKLHADL